MTKERQAMRRAVPYLRLGGLAQPPYDRGHDSQNAGARVMVLFGLLVQRALGWSLALLVVLALALGGAQADQADPMPPPLSKEDLKHYLAAFDAANAGHWPEAKHRAAQAHNPLGRKLLDWMDYYRDYTTAGFREISAFIRDNPDWPGLDRLAANAERVMENEVSDQEALAWFRYHDPVSRAGRERMIGALRATGERAAAAQVAYNSWINDDFAAAEQKRFLARYRDLLQPSDHLARLDRLLWDDDSAAARRMFALVDHDHQALALARIALRAKAGNVDTLVNRVPHALTNDLGLLYERVRWRRNKGMEREARALLLSAPKDFAHHRLWWQERAKLARSALTAGAITDAYRLASEHRLVGGAAFAEAEWLSGWIALRFLNESDTAERHFRRLYEGVASPISVARAAYWIGRAAEARGDSAAREHWYATAAKQPATFYGQLAASRLEKRPDDLFAGLAEDLKPQDQLPGHELVACLRLLITLDQDDLVLPFLNKLAGLIQGARDHILIERMMLQLGRPDLAVRAAKSAAQKGYASVTALYPVVEVPFALEDGALERALVMALVRQESLFYPKAVSPAGALGLMQILPSTAAATARSLKIRFTEKDLIRNPALNVRLGSDYLRDLIEHFDGSYILAIAAYNGGPTNVARWRKANGDPLNDATVDLIDWIEAIPLEETRNYVQRVLEGLQVYRWQRGRTVNAADLERDLVRGMSPKSLAVRCRGADKAVIKVADIKTVC
jgi:soluble lytic murein transglycosylase